MNSKSFDVVLLLQSYNGITTGPFQDVSAINIRGLTMRLSSLKNHLERKNFLDARYLKFSESEIMAISSKIISLAEKDDLKWLITWSHLRLGTKIAELIRLQRQDIIWNENILQVSYREGQVKRVPFDDTYRERLKDYLSSRVDQSPSLFVKKSGKELLRSDIKSLLLPLCRKCGLVYPLDNYFCTASSILYQLPLRESMTETANIIGFHLVTKLMYFLKNAGLLQNDLKGSPINSNPVVVSPQHANRIALLKVLILGDER